jgi:uncharacterized protein YndB with AHSA1/START domain
MTKLTLTAEPGRHDCTMTREFKGTPEQLYRAYTDPDLVRQWLGPHRLQMDIREFDVRHGGRWSFVHREEGGAEYGFRGVFHGTPSVKDGITQTFEFEGMPGHVCLERVKFEEIAPGRTLVRNESVYQSVEDRDGMIESGMETGVTEGYERLDALLAANAIPA